MPEIYYRTGTPARGHFPGHHRSKSGDSGFEFRGHASLLDAPDPRRLDLHASLRDPFAHWIVRVYSQRKSIPVAIVADLSASMGFEGTRRKLDVLADFTDSLAWSVWRTGDSFGFVGCEQRVRTDLLLPQTRVRGVGQSLAATLRGLRPEGRSAQGLLEAHRQLSRQRSLVFLVSDFHLPLPLLTQVLRTLAQHDVVPVVVWDPAEFALAAPRGLAWAVDPESGERRLIWWRQSLRERWASRHVQRRHDLLAVFRSMRLKPIFVEQGFDPDAVTRHFHS
ncbi:MAG: MxaS protein [Burkholderiaceae bacterium]|nr:MxaS protein [Burkholderiaceae bacterium]